MLGFALLPQQAKARQRGGGTPTYGLAFAGVFI